MTVEDARENVRRVRTVRVASFDVALDDLIAAVREEEQLAFADALMSGERGDDLLQVARNAHSAEMELAALQREPESQ